MEPRHWEMLHQLAVWYKNVYYATQLLYSRCEDEVLIAEMVTADLKESTSSADKHGSALF